MAAAGTNNSFPGPHEWIDSLGLPLEDEYGEHLRELINHTEPCPVRLESYLLLYRCLPQELRPHPPLRLQDHHISLELALQRVIHAPSLLVDLKNDFCTHLSNFIRTHNPDISPSPYPQVERQPAIVSDAEGLIEPYMLRIGSAAIQYAGKLHIHPDAIGWHSTLYHSACSAKEYFLYEYAIRVRSVTPRSRHFYQHLDDLHRHRSALCVFSFYPPSKAGEDAVEACLHHFTPTFATADAYAPLGSKHSEERPSDWEDSFWSAYVSKACFGTTAKIRSRPGPQKTRMWVPGRIGQRSSEYKPHAPHFVQRAWNTAVENDATFIVFSSGNTERIGIRHRATNTLFLSDVIKITDDSYYWVQMALFSAMAQDGLALTNLSMSQRRSGDTLKSSSSPKPDGAEVLLPSPERSLKQRKVTHTRVLPPEFDEEMARRPVVLITFNVGVHRSHKASAFLRKKPACTSEISELGPAVEPKAGKMYPIWDCINIEIDEVLGSGYECQIFRGTARMVSKSDISTIIEGPVVLKVPHASYMTRGLLKEYKAYSQLASKGVTEGIIKIRGLFEDPETGHTMLIMQDAGRATLEERDRQKFGREPADAGQFALHKISEAEFKTLRRIVQSINEAGVLHFDLKPDNIMLGEDGALYVIDFGVAEFTTRFFTDLDEPDPPWSQIDPHALAIVEADSSGIHSFDRQTIEDLFIGRYKFDRRYGCRHCDFSLYI